MCPVEFNDHFQSPSSLFILHSPWTTKLSYPLSNLRFGHKKEKHTGAVEIFPCPDCGKNFSRKSNLKVRKLNRLWRQTKFSVFQPFAFRLTEIPYISAKSSPVPSVSGFLQIEALWTNTSRKPTVTRWSGSRDKVRALDSEELLWVLSVFYLMMICEKHTSCAPGNPIVFANNQTCLFVLSSWVNGKTVANIYKRGLVHQNGQYWKRKR